MDNRLDHLLARYREATAQPDPLPTLEQDVWRTIRLAEDADQPCGRFEQLLVILFQPRHRFASLAAAILLGLFLGSGGWPGGEQSRTLPAEALHFDVFSSQYNALLPARSVF